VLASFPRTSYASLGQLVVTRGFNVVPVQSLVDVVKKGVPRVEWGIPPPFAVESIAKAVDGTMSSVTVCSNGTNIVPIVETLLERAARQFHARAYVHWYAKFGVDTDYFTESFVHTQAIVDEYHALNQPDE
ncbi:hypothetical protein DYB34_008745, partial [Aphanomyces astaci]